MNRREDLQQFFISANTSQDRHDFDFEKFTDEYLIRNPDVVNENDLSHNVINSVCPRCYGAGSYTVPGMGGTNKMDCRCKAK